MPVVCLPHVSWNSSTRERTLPVLIFVVFPGTMRVPSMHSTSSINIGWMNECQLAIRILPCWGGGIQHGVHTATTKVASTWNVPEIFVSFTVSPKSYPLWIPLFWKSLTFRYPAFRWPLQILVSGKSLIRDWTPRVNLNQGITSSRDIYFLSLISDCG